MDVLIHFRSHSEATSKDIIKRRGIKDNEKLKQLRALKEQNVKNYSQDECLELLRKCVEKAPIPPIQKSTLTNITKV